MLMQTSDVRHGRQPSAHQISRGRTDRPRRNATLTPISWLLTLIEAIEQVSRFFQANLRPPNADVPPPPRRADISQRPALSGAPLRRPCSVGRIRAGREYSYRGSCVVRAVGAGRD